MKKPLTREGSSFPGGTDTTSIVEVLYVAFGLTRSESEAADLVQQTFLVLIQRLEQIRDFSKIKCWLFTTLRRNFFIKIRRHRKHPEVEFRPDVHDSPVGDQEVGGLWMQEAFKRGFCELTKRTGLHWSFFT